LEIIFARNSSAVASYIEAMDGDGRFEAPRFLTRDGGLRTFPGDDSEAGHLLAPLPSRAATAVVIHHSNLLFKSSWSRAFLEHAATAVAEDGMIVVPEPRPSRMPLIDAEDLARIFGPPIDSMEIDSRTYLCFSTPPRTNTPSTLRWAVDHQDALHDGERDRAALIGRFDIGTRPDPLEPLMAAGCTIPAAEPNLHAATDASRAEGLFSYFHVDVAPKMAIMSRLASEVEIERPLHHVDVGGGMGNLGAELILDPSNPVATSLNVEFDAARMIMGRSLLEMYESELAGNWSFQLEFAQDHAFRQQADIISMVSSMLYVPRGELLLCMERAWDSLNPGGILLFYEHIKHPRFVRDHHVMFEKDEMESMLQRFGDFDCISGTSLVSIPNEDVGEKSVYRVLRKPR
jgi:SAM-dependent methyltransferase